MALVSASARGTSQIDIEQPDGQALESRVIAWGDNYYGQLNPPPGLTDVSSIAAGGFHILALKQDGTLVAWGRPDYGAAEVPADLGPVTAVAGGINHTLAVKSDGTVRGWGDNFEGQANVPAGLSGVMAVAGGWWQSLAIRSGGRVVSWGREESAVPAAALSGVVAVAEGFRHSVALKSNGTVVCWGSNEFGETTPPPGLSGVTAIAAGRYFSVALKSDGSVAVWGGTEYGDVAVPAGLSEVKAISAGAFHVAGLRRDGGVVTWGYNSNGQLEVPTDLRGMTSISAGYAYTAGLQRTAAFGDQPVALPSEAKIFVIRNTGTDSLAITGLTVTGADADEFAVDTTTLLTEVPPFGGTTVFKVIFTPSTAGARTVVLHVQSNDPYEGRYDIVLTGTGLGPELSVSGGADIINGDATPSLADETDFGPADTTRETVVRTFSLANTGTTALNLTGTPRVSITGTHAADFTVTTQPTTPVAAEGGLATFQIAFVAGATGLRTATVTIANDDHDEGTFTFEIQGTGIAAPEIAVEQTGGPGLTTGVVAWGANVFGQSSVPGGMVNVTSIAAGGAHTLAARSDGRVVAWGLNDRGQRTVPSGLSGVIAVAAGSFHSVALKNDGTVVSWGNNGAGQNTVPAGLSAVTAIAAGQLHTVALKSDGTVVAWGNNSNGQTSVPADLKGVIAIAAGAFHTMALKNDGRIIAWGSNQEGAGTVPAGLTGVGAIAAGGYNSMALKRDGTVVVWGSIGFDLTTVPAGLTNVAAIDVGHGFAVAARHDGTVVAWGNTADDRSIVPDGLSAVNAVAAGDGHTAARQSLVNFGNPFMGGSTTKSFTIKNSGHGPLSIGSVSLVGEHAADFLVDTTAMASNVAALGGSTTFSVTFTPTVPGQRKSVLRILTDDPDERMLNIALTGTGIGPEIGVSGNGVDIVDGDTTPNRSNATDFGRADTMGGPIVRTFTIANTGNAVLTLSGTPRVAISGDHAADFTVIAQPAASVAASTGTSTFKISLTPGAIGLRTAAVSIANGDANESPFEFAIQGTGVIAPEIAIEQPSALGEKLSVVSWGGNEQGQATLPSGLDSVTSIGAGRLHSMALTGDGAVVAWGDNTYGQATVPAGLTPVKAVAAGDYHSVALKIDGTVVAWGRNDGGQSTPPNSLSNVTAIAAGRLHTLALRSDGKVVAWGDNSSGQRTVPASLAGVIAIAGGYSHSVALKTDGKVVAWGANTYGQTSVPAGLTGVTSIAAGHDHTLALKADGSVVAWGRNDFGQRTVPPGLTGVVAIAADYSQSLALKHDGSIVGWGLNDSEQTIPPAGLRPITALEAGGFHSLALQPTLFADQLIATASEPRIFSIANTGHGPLSITSMSLTGEDAGDFEVNATGMLSTVPALTGSTAFSVTFKPNAAKTSRAALRIVSDDIDEETIDIVLTGRGVSVTAYGHWSASMSLVGTAAHLDAAPHGDGIENLLKFAFNMNGAAPDTTVLTPGTGTRGLPVVSITGSGQVRFMRVEFLRRRDAGLLYAPQWSSTLGIYQPMTAAPMITFIDTVWERVVVNEPLGDPAPAHLFGRVSVSLQ